MLSVLQAVARSHGEFEFADAGVQNLLDSFFTLIHFIVAVHQRLIEVDKDREVILRNLCSFGKCILGCD